MLGVVGLAGVCLNVAKRLTFDSLNPKILCGIEYLHLTFILRFPRHDMQFSPKLDLIYIRKERELNLFSYLIDIAF